MQIVVSPTPTSNFTDMELPAYARNMRRVLVFITPGQAR
jgi:hypothetical protein